MGRNLKIRGIHRRILGYFARGDPIPFIIHNTGLNPGNYYKKIHTLEKYVGEQDRIPIAAGV